MGVASRVAAGGNKGMRWTEVGQTLSGTLTWVKEVQDTDFKTQAPLFWDEAKTQPVMVPVLTLQTDLRESEDDQGLRDLWCRTGLFTAFRDALREAGLTGVEDADLIGYHLTVRFLETVPSKNPRFNARKVFAMYFGDRVVRQEPADSSAGPPEPPPLAPQADEDGEDGGYGG